MISIDVGPSLSGCTLVIGDPHFKLGNQSQTDALLPFVVDKIRTSKCGVVVVLGDVLDRHETIHMAPLTRAIAFLRAVHDLDVYLFVLIGNHDRANNQDFCSPVHPFTALKEWPRTFIVDTPLAVEFRSGDVRRPVAFCPYVPPGRFEESLALLRVEQPQTFFDIIFAHQEFRNAKLGAFVSENGDEWSEQNSFVISGHIHQYDRLQSNILYVGTPLQLAFSDTDRKCLLLIDLMGESVVPDRFEQDGKSIDCSELPGKRVLHLTAENFLETVETRVAPLLGSHHQVRIVVSGSKSQIATVRSSRLFTNLMSKVQLVTKIDREGKADASSSDQMFEDQEETCRPQASEGAPRRSFQERLALTCQQSGRNDLWSLWQSIQTESPLQRLATAAPVASVQTVSRRGGGAASRGRK